MAVRLLIAVCSSRMAWHWWAGVAAGAAAAAVALLAGGGGERDRAPGVLHGEPCTCGQATKLPMPSCANRQTLHRLVTYLAQAATGATWRPPSCVLAWAWR